MNNTQQYKPTKRRVNLLNVDKMTPAQENLFRKFGAIHNYDQDTKYWTLGDAYYITNELIIQFNAEDRVHIVESAKSLCDEIVQAVRRDHKDLADKCGHILVGSAVEKAVTRKVMFEHVLGLDNVDRMGYDHTHKLYELISYVRGRYIKQKNVDPQAISFEDMNELDVLAFIHIINKLPGALDIGIDHNHRHLIADIGDAIQKIAEVLAPNVTAHIREVIMSARGMYYEEKKHQLNYEGYAELDDDDNEVYGENSVEPTKPIRTPDEDEAERMKYMHGLMQRISDYKSKANKTA